MPYKKESVFPKIWRAFLPVNEIGAVATSGILILVAGIGLTAFIMVSSVAPFGGKLAEINQKPATFANTTSTTPSPTPASAQDRTVTFDDNPGENQPLNNHYPQGVIDWGNNNWFVSGPWKKLTTKSLSFHGKVLKKASFTILTPQTLKKLDIYNGGGGSATTTISCTGQPTLTVALLKNELKTGVETGWQTPCSVVTIASTNGWNTNYDNFVLEGPAITVDKTEVNVTLDRNNAVGGIVYGEGFKITSNSANAWQVTPTVSTPGQGFYEFSGGTVPGRTSDIRVHMFTTKPNGVYTGSAVVKYSKNGVWFDGPTVSYTINLVGVVPTSPTPSPTPKTTFLIKPYLVYPADKPMYPEYETAVRNYMTELRNWYTEKVGFFFTMTPLQVVRSSENYLTMRCGPTPSQNCLDNPAVLEGNWGMYMNKAIHNGLERWDEQTAVLIFSAGGGGYAGANQYPNYAGWAITGDWVLEPISGKANDWGIPCRYSDGWQCAGGVPKGSPAHELGHAFGLPHPGAQYNGQTIMQWHGDYPGVGFIPQEINFLRNSPFFK